VIVGLSSITRTSSPAMSVFPSPPEGGRNK
jgi:hypothetical protein